METFARGEQGIMDAALVGGYLVIHFTDIGFPERYHPSAELVDACANSHFHLVTLWHYLFRRQDDAIHLPFCKAMNCIAQTLCKTKDNWWKMPATANATNST